MKIGILTQPLRYNYGGLLQAYALQTWLQRQGHEVWILDRRQKVSFIKGLPGIIKRLLICCLTGKSIYIFNRERQRQLEVVSRNTQSFIDRYLNRTEPLLSTRKLKEKVIGENFDAVIVGSDQVWRPDYSPCMGNYFLDFLPPDTKIKRLAYAASFGVDEWKYSSGETRLYGRLLQRFDAVSVREQGGVNLCKNKLGREAVYMPDPTMLLLYEDYMQLYRLYPTECSAGQVIVYMLDRSKSKLEMARRIADVVGLNYRLINAETDNWFAPLEERIAPAVEEWLENFKNAAFVVTDSFHGCVFSILFNKPFWVLGNKERGMARFDSLLEIFQLQDRMIFSSEELVRGRLMAKPDWQKVNRILEQQRENAGRFLKYYLSEG